MGKRFSMDERKHGVLVLLDLGTEISWLLRGTPSAALVLKMTTTTTTQDCSQLKCKQNFGLYSFPLSGEASEAQQIIGMTSRETQDFNGF